MADYVRTQVLLDRNQREQLDRIADQAGVSFSELVRELLDTQLRVLKYEEMRRAAEQLSADYAHDPDLTDTTALDGEDFLHA
jgi:hypothetical protein